MKLVILLQQVQIKKLKKMVLRLVQKKKRKQYVSKKRSDVNDAFKKGESQAEGEKQSPVGMESKFKGELGTEAESSKAAETFNLAAGTEKVAVETIKVAAETGLTAKGVEIKEGGLTKKRKEASIAEIMGKGKEKVAESVKASKKQSQIALDEELARKMQADLEKENEIQSVKDREIALELAKKINEEYQKSLKSAAAAKKVTKKASRQRLPLKTRQRQPSKTYLANQERRKMINFWKGFIGVPEGMFSGMSFGKLEELYQKKMAKLKGDFSQREGTPIKENTEAKQEETLAQQVGAIKTKKSIATKPKAKRPIIEEVEKEIESARAEPSAEPEQNPE
ncbi:hypothetical protein L6452_05677 [Arctium lappa]|uniref:Uncharacterized protein n=1 Tax=Arctium lappa TaxID=4217 RepID=A0ACB9EI39_ARCLA|nr:hypothetical protein L6452_05677 [Arctium lappa]